MERGVLLPSLPSLNQGGASNNYAVGRGKPVDDTALAGRDNDFVETKGVAESVSDESAALEEEVSGAWVDK